MRSAPAIVLLVLAVFGTPGTVQPADPPNGILLVAKRGMSDPRFREAVVLVTQTADFETVGLILNKPLQTKLAELAPENLARHYTGRIYYGGPVAPQTLVALLRAKAPPDGPAFRVLRNVWLSMHPTVVEPLLSRPGDRYRLYVGFSGWMTRQLEAEMKRADSWHMLPATEELIFRADTAGMWEELIGKADGSRAQAKGAPVAALRLYWSP